MTTARPLLKYGRLKSDT